MTKANIHLKYKILMHRINTQKLEPGLVASNDLRPRNKAGSILRHPGPTRALAVSNRLRHSHTNKRCLIIYISSQINNTSQANLTTFSAVSSIYKNLQVGLICEWLTKNYYTLGINFSGMYENVRSIC